MLCTVHVCRWCWLRCAVCCWFVLALRCNFQSPVLCCAVRCACVQVLLAEVRRLLLVRAKERFSRRILSWPYGGVTAEVRSLALCIRMCRHMCLDYARAGGRAGRTWAETVARAGGGGGGAGGLRGGGGQNCSAL